MKILSSFILLIVTIALCATSVFSQIRQDKLYIDDSSGHFMVLKAAHGGGTLVLPAGSGTVETTYGVHILSTEVDTAKSANTVTISGSTSAATVTNNGSTAGVTASVTAGTSGQVLYLFNNLGNTNSVTLAGYSIGDGKIGIFIYLSGAWRSLVNSAIAAF